MHNNILCAGVWLPMHVCVRWESVVSLQGDQVAQGGQHAASHAAAVNTRHAAADLNTEIDLRLSGRCFLSFYALLGNAFSAVILLLDFPFFVHVLFGAFYAEFGF